MARWVEMTTTPNKRWTILIEGLSDTFEGFEKNSITMEEAFTRVRRLCHQLDPHETQAIMDILSEIDGFPDRYKGFRNFLLGKPSHAELTQYIA